MSSGSVAAGYSVTKPTTSRKMTTGSPDGRTLSISFVPSTISGMILSKNWLVQTPGGVREIVCIAMRDLLSLSVMHIGIKYIPPHDAWKYCRIQNQE